MLEFLKAEWAARPWWMNLLFGFCAYMAIIYVPWDLFIKPIEQDVEVWFGIALHGWAAKLTTPLHWLIYGFGAYGFWRMKSWMWPWAAVYAAQVAIGMLVWAVLDPRASWGAGIVAGAILMIPTVALWRARDQFDERRSAAPDPVSAP